MKTVVAALMRMDDKVLICQRSRSGSFPGKWEFPGGKLETDETPQSALRRELLEELGIEAEIGAELWRTEHQYAGHSPVLLIFHGVVGYRGAEKNLIFENIEWAKIEALPAFDFLEGDLDLVGRIAAKTVGIPETLQTPG